MLRSVTYSPPHPCCPTKGCPGGEDIGHQPLREPMPHYPIPESHGNGASGYRSHYCACQSVLFLIFFGPPTAPRIRMLDRLRVWWGGNGITFRVLMVLIFQHFVPFWASAPKGVKPSHLITYGRSFHLSLRTYVCTYICPYVCTPPPPPLILPYLNPLITFSTEMGHREPMTINAFTSSFNSCCCPG
jgi:hypothetical protein